MASCCRCFKLLPPPFMEEMPDGEKMCRFCIDGVTKLEYGDGKFATKSELEREYQMFLNELKDKNDILRKFAKGDASEVPEKLI